MSEYSDFIDETQCDFCHELLINCDCDEEDANEQPWIVEVKYNGEQLITIERNCYYGKSELTKEDRNVIRNCARELFAFVGEEEPEEQLSDDGIPF